VRAPRVARDRALAAARRAAERVVELEHGDVGDAAARELPAGGQAGDAGADDRDVVGAPRAGGRGPRVTGVADQGVAARHAGGDQRARRDARAAPAAAQRRRDRRTEQHGDELAPRAHSHRRHSFS
jgi:hypothetical protein